MMIDKIKNKIVAIISKLENKAELNYNYSQDQMAYNQLLKMFDNNIFIPITNWSISPKEVIHICNDIVINNRTNIIEFGSGFSTICIAQLLKINNIKANFISIEDNSDWGAELTRILQNLKLEAYVKIVISSIKEVPRKYAKETQKIWYDTAILEEVFKNINTVDLVIVDGPFGDITPFARYSAVPFLKEKLAVNYTIFLDDSYRIEEKQIVEDWHLTLAGEVKSHKRYTCLSNEFLFDVSPYV
ncbi:hypothetical protein [Patiriisocius sp. Uisw_017]|jgi:hypothetical protein|uniref:hypothetical protein n=1 Tax=Patiriisocius sp. Uisw_017 TaxID=3230968 RepID=UPI0039EAC63A